MTFSRPMMLSWYVQVSSNTFAQRTMPACAERMAGVACQVNLPETRLHRRITACIKIFTV